MPLRIDRYENNREIVEHLASQYVCGLLPPRVHNRVKALLKERPNGNLHFAVSHWEQELSSLDSLTPELPPEDKTWDNIEASLGFVDPKPSVISRLALWFSRPSVAFANALFAVMAFSASIFFISSSPKQDALSYLAVLSYEEKPQVIAATYGQGSELKLDVLALPSPGEDEDYELWVVSKTDGIARSLGTIDVSSKTQSRPLSSAQWRLIKDSHSLLITLEEAGGSPFGEPFGEIVSKGLCIQMPAWEGEA